MNLLTATAALVLGAWLMNIQPLWAATDLAAGSVPEQLRPWVPWVLYDQLDKDCPSRYNAADQPACHWPGVLALSVDESGGEFEQSWEVYAEGWVGLPGDREHWPLEVVRLDPSDNARPQPIGVHGDHPSLWLTPGRHTVRGRFHWRQTPESLSIPAATGLLNLRVDGVERPFAERDADGKLWLRGRSAQRRKQQQDRLRIRVFRRLDDTIPMVIDTRIQLDVAGRERSVVLRGALLPSAIPVAIDSRLPARLEADGSLRLQLRPGQWSLDLVARQPGPVEAIRRPADAKTDTPLSGKGPGSPATGDARVEQHRWPEQEVWAFQARPRLRLVAVEGVSAVDPTQTGLPKAWRTLPAYRVPAGATVVFKTLRRGDPDPAPDRLRLSRTLWLDFDGGGYTFRDVLNGTLSAGWRLSMGAPYVLGQVLVDGVPRLITHDPRAGAAADPGAGDAVGVELRRGGLRMEAEGRVEGLRTEFDAVGWRHDVQRLEMLLNLPPGWRLLGGEGADSTSAAWLQDWSLLDLFLVLVVALAVGRLWGWPWVLLALPALVLSYHEADAPRWVWIQVLAATALLRVAPPGRLYRVASMLRIAALAGLVLLSLPFLVSQVRMAIYPQLEYPWVSVAEGGVATMGRVVDDLVGSPEPASVPSRARKAIAGIGSYLDYETKAARRKPALTRYDPKAHITTGPGLPAWQWTSVRLGWNGPVEQGQQIGLWLVTPGMMRLWRLLAAGLVLLLMLRVLVGRGGPKSYTRGGEKAASSAALVLPLLGVLLAAAPVDRGLGAELPNTLPDRTSNSAEARATAADATGVGSTALAVMPSPELLRELGRRLTRPARCFPTCAQIQDLELTVADGDMSARLAVHAQAQVGIPLPGDGDTWHRSRVLLDGVPAPVLRPAGSPTLWLVVPPGRHEIGIIGPLAERGTVPLPLPLKPHRVTLAGSGWSLEGVDQNGVPQAQVQLRREAVRDTAVGELAQEEFPPFAQVERTLLLGLEWQVHTRVARDPRMHRGMLLEVPLLPGESVITPGIRVREGRVQVGLDAGREALEWTSTLEQRDALTLQAPSTTSSVEVWTLEVSPIWHVTSAGLAVVQNQDPAGRWRPEWRPWPGEQVILAITRPRGIEGATLTLDRTRITMRPGKRATDTTLSMRLRSSQGGQHRIRLPEGARLLSAKIDAKLQPVRQRGDDVTLPIRPGVQQVELVWRKQAAGEGSRVGAGLAAMRLRTPVPDLGLAGVNLHLDLEVPRDRWVLFVAGPLLGPAVLFWGIVLVMALVAIGLARTAWSPMGFWQWFLLGLGLSQAPVVAGLVVVVWLLALGARGRMDTEHLTKTGFNTMQVLLVVLTLGALASLFVAVEQGLLGSPDMQIVGNGSDGYALRWYQDRTPAQPPSARAWTVPLWVYRGLMLAWALWLAFALLSWLRWGWEGFSRGGLWHKLTLQRVSTKPRPKPESKPATSAPFAAFDKAKD